MLNKTDRVKTTSRHADVPLTESELYDKFADCLKTGQSELPPEKLFDRPQTLEQISVRRLAALS
jgi:hypothetical protein